MTLPLGSVAYVVKHADGSGLGVRLTWAGDKRRVLEFDVSSLDFVGDPLADPSLAGRGAKRALVSLSKRLWRWRLADPLADVTIRYHAPLLSITLERGVWWTASKVRAVTAACAQLGADFAMSVDRSGTTTRAKGLSGRSQWGENVMSRLIVVTDVTPAPQIIWESAS